MSGIFSNKPDIELEQLSKEKISDHFRVGKYDGELYWQGKKIKRGGFSFSENILIACFTVIAGLLTTLVLLTANLDKICNNTGMFCPSSAAPTIGEGESNPPLPNSPPLTPKSPE